MSCWNAEVLATGDLGPHLTRITLGGDGLREFRTLGTPDECVTLFFPRAGESAPPPMTLVDDVWGYHGMPDAPIGRNYTVRAADRLAGTVTVDFVRHGDGVASTWAERAAPGDGLVLWRQRSWYQPPDGTEWIVLATDLTGLPAAARIVEQHTGPAPITLVADVLDPADVADVGAEFMDVRVGGNGLRPSTLVERMRALSPDGPNGYVWFAGEAGDARRARKLWREEFRLSRDRITSIGYWRAEAEAWLARYEPVRADVERLYQESLDAGVSATEAADRVEAELERRGL